MSVRPLLKWSVVVNSVLTVTAFICYQAGAFNWLARSRPAEKQENSDEMFGSSKVKTIFGGSKSDILVQPNTPSPGQGKPADDVLFGGSKYAKIGTFRFTVELAGEGEKNKPKEKPEK